MPNIRHAAGTATASGSGGGTGASGEDGGEAPPGRVVAFNVAAPITSDQGSLRFATAPHDAHAAARVRKKPLLFGAPVSCQGSLPHQLLLEFIDPPEDGPRRLAPFLADLVGHGLTLAGRHERLEGHRGGILEGP